MPYERKTVDINSSEKFKKFLTEFRKTSEIADLLSKERIPKDLIIDNNVDYISISEDDSTKISYLTQERINLVKSLNECLWTSKKRFHCKPGSFISKILKDANPKDVETFSNQFKSLSTKQDLRFEIVEGENLREYYHEGKYASQKGSLGSSCMKYDKCQKYFDIYVENPTVVKMLVMKNAKDLIVGRALLWNFSWEGKDYKIMDRIYTAKDEEFSMFFKNWALENGYFHKKHQNWANTLQFQEVESEIRVGIQLDKFTFLKYPYLDTFKWIDMEKGILYNYLPDYFKRENYNHKLICTPEGYTEWPDYLAFDEIDRCWSYRGDIIDVDGVRTGVYNCAWSETMNKYILKSKSTYSNHLKDYIYSDMSLMDPNLIKERINYLYKGRLEDIKAFAFAA